RAGCARPAGAPQGRRPRGWRRASQAAAAQRASPGGRPRASPSAAGGSPETAWWEAPRRRALPRAASGSPSSGTQSNPKARGTPPTQTSRAARALSEALLDLGGDDQYRGQPLGVELVAAAEQRGHARVQAALGRLGGLPVEPRQIGRAHV